MPYIIGYFTKRQVFAILLGMQTKIIEKYFFFGLLIATFIFTFFIFQPFWIIIVLGISFAIVLYPIYEWLCRRGLPATLSSLMVVALFTILVCGPLLGIGALVFKQSQSVYQKVLNSNLNASPVLDKVNYKVNSVLPEGVSFDMNQKATEFVSYVSSHITTIFSSTISAFFSFILMLLIIFYLLKDGARWRESIISLSPLTKDDDEKIISRLTLAVNGVVKGSLLIALAQGVLLGFGFWIFNVPNGALWGVVAAVLSFIPTFGTSLVSIPAIIFLFVTGNTTSAVGLLVWAVVIVGLVDNLLGPLVVGRKMNIPSILIMFSVLGGIALLGPVGILVGPLVVSLLYSLISIYKNEFNKNIVS
jgi:predicted PurR-regulated permease PerM